MSIRVVIRGNARTAHRAAARRGIALKACSPMHFRRDVRCDVPCSQERAVANWFGERETRRSGRGAAPGTVLFYNTECGLSGASRARRRRRR